MNQGGTKFDTNKVPMHLLSTVALIEVSKALDFGRQRYGEHNWRGGLKFSRLLGAALRHIFAYLGGESKDPDSGLSHIAHAVTTLMFLLEFEVTKPELDDRYKPSSDVK